MPADLKNCYALNETRSAVKITSIREDSFFALRSIARYFKTGRIITLQIFIFFPAATVTKRQRPFPAVCLELCGFL